MEVSLEHEPAVPAAEATDAGNGAAKTPDALHAEGLLHMQAGRLAEARERFLAALALDAAHFGALNDLGVLLYRQDFRSAARLAYAEAVRIHPHEVVGRINLANALFANEELAPARLHYEAALRLAPRHPDALQGLANLLQHEGDAEGAERLRQESYAGRTAVVTPYRGAGRPQRVLHLVSAVGGNVPTRFILEDGLFETSTLVVEADRAGAALPDHDVVFNAVGDPDLAPEALDAAGRILERTPAPVINPPERVRLTGRSENARRLAGLPGVRAPRIEALEPEALRARAGALAYPLLLRAPGHHTGRHFRLVRSAKELDGALKALPGRTLLAIEYLNARGPDGLFRKYRAMIVGAEILPLHLAVSPDWKVHYFTADMEARADHRAEERAFLEAMEAVLGPSAYRGLRAIAEALALDYGGVDFGLSPGGELLLFEANATMVVNPPPPGPVWDYRRGPTLRILDAAQRLVSAAASRARR